MKRQIMGVISAKGFAAGDEVLLGGHGHRGPARGGAGDVVEPGRGGAQRAGDGKVGRNTRLGGRVDYFQTIQDVGDLTFSLTDATLKDLDNAPHLRQALITAERDVTDNVRLGAGYDLGLRSRGAFASLQVKTDRNVADKAKGAVRDGFFDRDASAKAIYFHDDNVVRAEAAVKIDNRSQLSAVYTFNSNANTANATYVNLRERQGFIIRPFTVDIAAANVKYSYETDSGYKLEPSVDLAKGEGYLAVSKLYRDNIVRGSYAIKEEHAMLEVERRPRLGESWPSAKFYAKAPAGPSGFGPLSLGFIVDKTFDF